MKKMGFVFFVLLLVCVFTLSACGAGAPSSGQSGTGSNEPTVPGNGESTDGPTKQAPVYQNMTITASLSSDGTSENLHHVASDQTFYLHVHLSNPDKFQILSFTLNGKVYSGDLFEQGSTYETLILKLNAGDASGSLSYTVEQIEYADGTEVKSAKIDKEPTITVEIKNEKQVSQVVISSLPHKLVYFVGEQANYTGFTVTTTYNDGTSLTEGPEACTFSGFNSAAPVAAQKISVTYGTYTLDYTIEIKEAPKPTTLQRISLETLPKTNYMVNDRLDVSGGVILLTYTDGSIRKIQLMPQHIRNFDSSQPGTYLLTVEYHENGSFAACSYEIMVRK